MEKNDEHKSERPRNLLKREPPLLIRYGTLVIIIFIAVFSVIFIYYYLNFSRF